MTTARDITAILRLLYPAPVRLSVRADTGPGSAGRYLIRLPSSPAASLEHGLAAYLGRHLATGIAPAEVKVVGKRVIRRRDCGRDVEFTVRVREEQS
jgi:hypothetical protein